jgi:hypothetical protein
MPLGNDLIGLDCCVCGDRKLEGRLNVVHVSRVATAHSDAG